MFVIIKVGRGAMTPTEKMMEAALVRVNCVLEAACKNIVAQFTSNQREAVFQKALAAELHRTFNVEQEAYCPVLYTALDGSELVMAAERIDILIRARSRQWAVIIEVKRGPVYESAIQQARRYCENYRKTQVIPLAGAFLVSFAKYPCVYTIKPVQ